MIGLAERLESLIEPAVAAMGYCIVRVQLMGQQRLRLQIMVERGDGQAMNVDDCADVSRAVSAVLDVDDPIAGAYTLEVSSPGIDRPLVRLADYDRFAGFEARIELSRLVDGRRRFRGRLLGTDGDGVRLTEDDGSEAHVPFTEIARAKLVLTDDLIAASTAKATKPSDARTSDTEPSDSNGTDGQPSKHGLAQDDAVTRPCDPGGGNGRSGEPEATEQVTAR